jgi:hypothetical protein
MVYFADLFIVEEPEAAASTEFFLGPPRGKAYLHIYGSHFLNLERGDQPDPTKRSPEMYKVWRAKA